MSYNTLTDADLAKLKTYILADPVLAPMTSGVTTDFNGIATAMSAIQPTFFVYKSQASTPGLGLVISYVAFAAVTAANQQQWMYFLQMNPVSYDPSRADIQSFMANTWSGALGGEGATTRAALVAYGIRQATRTEMVLKTGGNGAQATPATLTYEGSLTLDNVRAMFA